MRQFLWGVLLLVLAPSAAHAQSVLEWDDLALNRLYFLGNGLVDELAACGIGEVHGDTAVVTDIRLLPLHLSSTESVLPGEACPPGALVFWHNHPWTGPREQDGVAKPSDLCALGLTDLSSALNMGVPFIAVTVGRAERYVRLCWWTLDQVRAEPTFLRSIDGQRKRYWSE